jgi:hypothetical protein
MCLEHIEPISYSTGVGESMDLRKGSDERTTAEYLSCHCRESLSGSSSWAGNIEHYLPLLLLLGVLTMHFLQQCCPEDRNVEMKCWIFSVLGH